MGEDFHHVTGITTKCILYYVKIIWQKFKYNNIYIFTLVREELTKWQGKGTCISILNYKKTLKIQAVNCFSLVSLDL